MAKQPPKTLKMNCSSRLFHSLIILDVKNMFLFVVVCLGFSNLRLCPLVSGLASPVFSLRKPSYHPPIPQPRYNP